MITERRPDVWPFSAIEFIANWPSGRSFPNHYVPASNGGFAKGSPRRSPSENGPVGALQSWQFRIREVVLASKIDFGLEGRETALRVSTWTSATVLENCGANASERNRSSDHFVIWPLH